MKKDDLKEDLKDEEPKEKEAEPAPEPKAISKTWHGLPLFECPNCPYATVNKTSYDKHVCIGR